MVSELSSGGAAKREETVTTAMETPARNVTGASQDETFTPRVFLTGCCAPERRSSPS